MRLIFFMAIARSALSRCEQSGLVDLVVTAHSAHVKKADVFSPSDPYAQVSVGEVTHRTAAEADTNHPEWNEKLFFPCSNRSTRLHVDILDYDSLGSDELLMYSHWDSWDNAPVQTKKLYNKNHEGAEYWVLLAVNWTVAEKREACPASCTDGRTCAEIDSNFGITEGICDNAGKQVATRLHSIEITGKFRKESAHSKLHRAGTQNLTSHCRETPTRPFAHREIPVPAARDRGPKKSGYLT